ncbi:divergent polysaccharide deacetylase family protein [Anaerotignum sp.]|nr:divergent polysaccharide deacetylase family protein [Anaerotignum sp.]MBQ8732940.1 divergent polysaccharide deacetylase family protein [Anaerotignum sp.]MBQ9091305.1 divergent polysaccharide deacetylase family protein [Anaerotignum sp.]
MNWKTGVNYLVLFGLCFLGGRFVASERTERTSGEKRGELAILIDDFGYCGEGTKEMLDLPIPFTAAVMPFSKCTEADAEAVRQAGKEIFIHMPMESLTGKREWVGDKGVFRDMTEAEIKARAEEAFSILPDAAGLNNHMGSAIMEDERSLSAVMDVLQEKNVMFVDSMTTAKSLGRSIAGQKGVTFLGRDVFLDSTDSVEEVKKNLRKAAEVALEKGYALAIGHVGPEGGMVTVQAIKELIPELKQAGITFVTVSELAK